MCAAIALGARNRTSVVLARRERTPRRLNRAAGTDPALPFVSRSHMPSGRVTFAAATILVALAACATSTAVSADPASAPPSFRQAQGWWMLTNGPASPPAAVLPHTGGWDGGTARIHVAGCSPCVQVDSWAATVRYRDAPNNVPWKTAATLGPSDSTILLIRSWQPKRPSWMSERHPLRILRSQIHSSFEGNQDPGHISEWSGYTWRNGSAVQVYVYFGSPRPSPEAVLKAQNEIDATRFPEWSIR